MKIVSFREFLVGCDANKEVSKSDLSKLEKYLDQVWGMLGVDVEFSRHFLDRINDTRNNRQITVCEVQKLFLDTYKKYGPAIKKMKNLEAVLTDLKTDVNVPFALKLDRRGDLELVAKTVMRKKSFVPNSKDEKHFKV